MAKSKTPKQVKAQTDASTKSASDFKFQPDGNLSLDDLQKMKKQREEHLEQTPLDFGLEERFLIFDQPRPAKPLIIAEGDSWFDLPTRADVIDWLIDKHRNDYRIDCFARFGDTLENMILGSRPGGFDGRGSDGSASLLAKVKAGRPRVLLFSGGGNDIVGPEMKSLLNHTKSGLPTMRAVEVKNTIAYLGQLLQALIDGVKGVSPETTIIMHGYDYAFPSGKAFIRVAWWHAGPWIQPVMLSKEIDPPDDRGVITQLIDAYNDLLKSLESANAANFRYVNVRGTAPNESDWHDELHLSDKSFLAVSKKIHSVITSLL